MDEHAVHRYVYDLWYDNKDNMPPECAKILKDAADKLRELMIKAEED